MSPMPYTFDTEEILKKYDVASNPNRKIVLDILYQASKALTPKIILEEIRKTRDFDKVTLYRILDLLTNKNILRKISTSQGVLCYEINFTEHHPHAHFICVECGELTCLESQNLTRILKEIRKQTDHGHSVDLKLEGVCSGCRKK